MERHTWEFVSFMFTRRNTLSVSGQMMKTFVGARKLYARLFLSVSTEKNTVASKQRHRDHDNWTTKTPFILSVPGNTLEEVINIQCVTWIYVCVCAFIWRFNHCKVICWSFFGFIWGTTCMIWEKQISNCFCSRCDFIWWGCRVKSGNTLQNPAFIYGGTWQLALPETVIKYIYISSVYLRWHTVEPSLNICLLVYACTQSVNRNLHLLTSYPLRIHLRAFSNMVWDDNIPKFIHLVTVIV